MMGALSRALSGDRSGTSSPRVHPSDDGGRGGAAASEMAWDPQGSEGQSLRQRHSLQQQHEAAENARQQEQGQQQEQQQRQLAANAAPDSQSCTEQAAAPPGGTVVLSVAAGEAATAAQGGAGPESNATAGIAAVRKKGGKRISFADPSMLVRMAGNSGAAMSPSAAATHRGRLNSLLKNSPAFSGGLRPDGSPIKEATPRPSLPRQSILAVYTPQRAAYEGSETTESVSDRKSSVFDLLERKKGRPESRWRAALLRFLQSGAFLLVSLLLTIMILYSDSLRVAAAPKSLDPAFLAFSLMVLAFFTLEAAATCIARPRYARSFYFWVDVVATLSILLDIPVLTDPVIRSADDGNGDVQQMSGMTNAASITSASTRAARLAQVTKWMRLWRIMKLWAFYCKNREHIIDRRTFMESELESSGQSRVGEKLTELTIRKVIIMVLLVMFAMPVFDASVGYYGGAPMLDDGGLVLLHAAYPQYSNKTVFVENMVKEFQRDTRYRLGRGYTGIVTHLVMHGETYVALPGNVDGLRDSEFFNHTTPAVREGNITTYMPCYDSDGQPAEGCSMSFVTMDVKWDSQIQGLLEIGRTTFTILILLLGAAIFITDTDRLVLKPLERMVQLLKEVSENPLAKLSGTRGNSSVSIMHQNSGVLSADTAAATAGSRKSSKASIVGKEVANGKEGKALETQVLESSIHKICSLLSVGFGEAGAEVIADNMRSGGDLNPMVPGRKVAAIFGFCDIRSFTDATEVLQEEVMEFVNSIAQIVHQEVALHGGAANKNIGDAFLLVWKLSGGRTRTTHDHSRRASLSRAHSVTSQRGSSGTAERLSVLYGAGGDSGTEAKKTAEETVAATADRALASFIIIQAALKRSMKLKEYCAREDLNQRMPGYQVNMGFGLHVGWAIEGAIGSEYKIDASYLSPHVNMASRLEAATKQYGATILLSDDFVRMLSPGVRAMVRQIDCVTVKGSIKPVGLYTYDVDVEGMEKLKLSQLKPLTRVPSAAAAASAAVAAEEGSSKAIIAASERHETYSARSYADEFAEHPDIVMTRAVDADFLAKFNEGFEAYRAGDWPAARAVLEETVEMRRDKRGNVARDGPSATLLRVMQELNFQAPANWAGFRELTDK